MNFPLSTRAAHSLDQPIGFLISLALKNPGIISLAAGLVDYETLPTPETRELLESLLTDDVIGRSRLQYGATLGLHPLREELIRHLARLDGQTAETFGATADQIVISNGSQQLLALLTEVLVNPGDIVITAWPSYFVYTGVLVTAGAEIRCVDTDADGVIPAKLDALLAKIESEGKLDRVKIVYIVDYHDNPTSLTLSEERRPQILNLVRKYSRKQRILLLEDAAYRELTFEGEPPKSMRSYDPQLQHVALLQTFSKPFAPGFKVGYGLLPADLIDKVASLKDNSDFGTANLCQHIVLKAMTSGLYDRHVKMLRARYHQKAQTMLDALQKYLGDFPGITWTHPRGGLYVWLTLPPRFDTSRTGNLFAQAVQEGVIYVPSDYCYPPDPTRQVPRNAMRLSFGTATLEQITEAIQRLSRAIPAVGGRQ